MTHSHNALAEVTTSLMLNEKQVADLVCHSVRTLQKWRMTGRGPAYCKFGQSVRYRRVDVLEWINARRVAHTAHAQGLRS